MRDAEYYIMLDMLAVLGGSSDNYSLSRIIVYTNRYNNCIFNIYFDNMLLMIGYFVFNLSYILDLSYNHTSSKWEQYWIQYTLGLLSVTVTAFTLVGCLCCRRPRRPKGFQVINCHFYITYNK